MYLVTQRCVRRLLTLSVFIWLCYIIVTQPWHKGAAKPTGLRSIYPEADTGDTDSNQNVVPGEPPLPDRVDLLLILTNTDENEKRKSQFANCVRSILKYATISIHFHIVTDDSSRHLVSAAINEKTSNAMITTYNDRAMAEKVLPHIEGMRKHFSSSTGAYYGQSIFYLAPVAHKIFPELTHLMAVDTDTIFADDIRQLYYQFLNFKDTEIMALAHDQQPVYFHNTWKWRSEHPDTRVGAPPPNGLTGFNSGVMLMRLDRMAKNQVYKDVIESGGLDTLSAKYSFKGHLGDQDLYTLLSFEHEELFHVLPCNWNRQICTWWYTHGYENRKAEYWNCEGKIHLWHANGGWPFPTDVLDELDRKLPVARH